jgi:hypothetical protein
MTGRPVEGPDRCRSSLWRSSTSLRRAIIHSTAVLGEGKRKDAQARDGSEHFVSRIMEFPSVMTGPPGYRLSDCFGGRERSWWREPGPEGLFSPFPLPPRSGTRSNPQPQSRASSGGASPRCGDEHRRDWKTRRLRTRRRALHPARTRCSSSSWHLPFVMNSSSATPASSQTPHRIQRVSHLQRQRRERQHQPERQSLAIPAPRYVSAQSRNTAQEQLRAETGSLRLPCDR